MKIQQAVQCVSCKRLHLVESKGEYATIYGQVTYYGSPRGGRDQSYMLGTQEEPQVVCANRTCMTKVLHLGEEDD